eukprot:m51a1_g8404 putative wd repeat-containing protein 19 isoform x1 (1404) ;mRNA; r:243939-249400
MPRKDKELFTITKKQHGPGSLMFRWHPASLYLATVGPNNIVALFDRTGQEISTVPLKGTCLSLEWDKEGEVLAIVQSGSSAVVLWDKNGRRTTTIDSGLKEPLTYAAWSHSSQLALCSDKGGVAMYNRRTQRKTTLPLKGPSGPITSAAWSRDNMLALVSDDRTLITVIVDDGTVIASAQLKGEIGVLQFSSMKLDKLESSKYKENTVSFSVSQKTLYLLSLDKPDNPIELAFQQKYGNITVHTWFGDGYLMLGFSLGHFVVISTSMEEIGQELFSGKFFEGSVMDIVHNTTLKRAAVCGDSTVKILESKNWKNATDMALIAKDRGAVEHLGWTQDGLILSVSTTKGFLSSYLTKVPVISAAYGTKTVTMASLRTVSIAEVGVRGPTLDFDVATEPDLVALGAKYLAVTMNNKAWFYTISPAPISGTTPQVNEFTYPGTVDGVVVNDKWAAVLYNDQVMLHLIDKKATQGSETTKIFPDRDDGNAIKDLALTSDFLVYGTAKGTIVFFHLGDWASVNEFRHSAVNTGIKRVVPNAQGTRVVFIDTASQGFMYNPVNDVAVKIPEWNESSINVVWDKRDWGVFIAVDPDQIHTFVYTPVTLSGPKIVRVSSMQKPASLTVLSVNNGSVTCQEAGGTVTSLTLSSHSALALNRGSAGPLLPEKRKHQFNQAIKLNRIKDAWALALKLNTSEIWSQIGKEALNQLDIPLAMLAYRNLGDPGMVEILEQFVNAEDTNLLAGHVNLLLGNYNEAQKLYLSSPEPLLALQMRRDLLHWEQAMALAKSLAPAELPGIAAECAQQLESKGDIAGALEMFSIGLQGSQPATEQFIRCVAGVARMTIRQGDISKGISIAVSSKNPQVMRDCAAILEQLKQFQEAANLYVAGQFYDKAAAIYIKTKQTAQLKEIMPRVVAPAIHAQYAKAREDEGDIAEAERSYMLAKDTDSVIRLNLKYSKTPEKAFQLARETGSQEGARMVAQFCQKVGDFRGAIEFLLMAKLTDDAFLLAQQFECMDKFAEVLGDKATHEQFLQIAKWYEKRGEFFEAGKFYKECEQYATALKLFLRTGESALLLAIEVVGKARDGALTQLLTEYLMGETDGIPKDPNYIFRMFMALGNYLQAARTAIIIARQEQEMGNYKPAHTILFDTFRVLDTNGIKVIAELRRNLCLLHSYIIAKELVKSKQHDLAARMLVRVCRNISKFPSHTVVILTTCVIECQRAGLKGLAFEFASMLVMPEYRKDIPPNYKKIVEGIVRKMEKTNDEEEQAPCPNCAAPLARSELDCPSCKSFLPYCVVSGRHMVLDDWSACPSCTFPALFSQLQQLAAAGGACPMCEQPVQADAIKREVNPVPILKKEIESVDIMALEEAPPPPSKKDKDKEQAAQAAAEKKDEAAPAAAGADKAQKARAKQ